MKESVWIINHYAIPPSMGGLVRHTYFSKYLMQKGYEVKIFTSSKIHNTNINMIADNSLYNEAEIDGMEYTFIKSSNYTNNGLARIKNLFEFPKNLGKTVKKFNRPDIIYTSSPDIFTAYKSIKIARKFNVPCITEIRDLWPESIISYNNISKNNPAIQILFRLEKWIYKKSDALIFTMEGGKDYIIEKGWDKAVDLEKIYNINNGIDIKEFKYNKDNYIINDDDLNDTDKFKIIYTGSIRKVNNLTAIINTAKYLQNENYKDLIFIIYGEGSEKDDLIKRCHNENIVNIVFKGRVEKKYIPYILSKADLNLYHWMQTPLMRFGSSGNKLFDYLASGRPILSTVNSGYDIIEKNNVGMISKDQTPSEIAKTILKVYNASNKEYTAICNNALNLAKDFDYETLTDKLISIIENII